MEDTDLTIDEAISLIEKDGYRDSDFNHFVEIKGKQYPCKALYRTILNDQNARFHTGEAQRFFRDKGYKLINKDPLNSLPVIWKVSHGFNEIPEEASFWLDQNSYITVHRDTAKSQGTRFIKEVQIGDIVSLSRSGYLKALVRVKSDVVSDDSSPLGEEWSLRRYELVKMLPELKKYTGLNKGWAPNYNNTLGKVYTQKQDVALFTKNILEPYYSMSLNDLLGKDDSDGELQVIGNINNQSINSPLNQILCGPPGTGKTYHTIEAAVKAAVPEEYVKLGINSELGPNKTQRKQLTEMYKALSDAGRIRFVTFHQSYGYEEFVEGLSAKTENEQISYYEKDGVFKKIVEDAKKHREAKTTEEKQDFDTLWNRFMDNLSLAESGVKVDTIRTFFMVTDVDNNTIRFEKDKGDSMHSMSIKTLKAAFNDEREIKGGLNPYYSALIKHLKSLAQACNEVKTNRQNYVLVIDEINRGNISKIFGELITLIEPSKRKGANEEIELILPCSGDSFSIPDNLYIIGTMNTADRSLAMMDTALRRRFDFKEMMPAPTLFNQKKIEWQKESIDLEQLLTKLNQRIEALYDREHTLGHAFFFPAYNAAKAGEHQQAFELLTLAFKNKIIPLLQEYFHDDWSKIALVLGDNQKLNAEDKTATDYQFVIQQMIDYPSLFGAGYETDNFGVDEYRFKLANENNYVWSRALAYVAIYEPQAIKRAAAMSEVEPMSTPA
ncbi:McrB family protein [Vibrio aestuarianus]|uniref:McrB family protein n=1 Tax=Vibrio aestuarianus TaxID=28171 RepID=UPI00237CFEF8|nr:AAA family ATPase [Vibrio aestuarianus]MDE1263080.1 AAA family ATPase [Vibrio aestuarianus]MDE1297249.1 AAA family ATPase [Vibrio aestuarianus]